MNKGITLVASRLEVILIHRKDCREENTAIGLPVLKVTKGIQGIRDIEANQEVTSPIKSIREANHTSTITGKGLKAGAVGGPVIGVLRES